MWATAPQSSRECEVEAPVFLYYNHSLLDFPVVPRDEYKGKSGNGDWGDCLLELDSDFSEILNKTDALGLRDNTIVIFAGSAQEGDACVVWVAKSLVKAPH
jgi:arylsulfatase A-like enzyme